MRVNSFHTMKFQSIFDYLVFLDTSSTGSNNQNFAKGTMDPKVEYFCFAKSNCLPKQLYLLTSQLQGLVKNKVTY